MPADLIHDPQAAHFPGDPDLYGVVCPEHAWANRKHLGQAHATNAVAKHNRDNHPDPVVNVTALAQVLLAHLAPSPEDATPLQAAQSLAIHHATIEALEALTGLPLPKALEAVEEWAAMVPPITASIAPF